MSEQIDYERIARWCEAQAERTVNANGSRATFVSDMFFEAASALRSLLEQREKLRQALKPFAAWLNEAEASTEMAAPHRADDLPAPSRWTGAQITLGDLRRARAALEDSK